MGEVRWRFATVAGCQVRYAVAGSGPAVVLPKKDRGFYVPFERLAKGYTMVQVEPLGFVRSDRPDPYPPVSISEQILAVCDREGIGEFAVWGFSQGGAMACATARATGRARLLVCGGFNVLRGLSDAWLARMNRECRIPVGSRTFWNAFHSYDWHAELGRIAVPTLMYWGSLDAQRVSVKDQYILRDLGVEFTEFADLNHGGCSSVISRALRQTWSPIGCCATDGDAVGLMSGPWHRCVVARSYRLGEPGG